MISFGQHLRFLRKQKNMSLRQFAKFMGWSATYQSDLELGRRGPIKLDKIVRTREVLGLNDYQYFTLLHFATIEELKKVIIRFKRIFEDYGNTPKRRCHEKAQIK